MAIFGSGPIGLMIGLLAQNINQKIIFIDINKKRLDLQKNFKLRNFDNEQKKLINDFYSLNVVLVLIIFLQQTLLLRHIN